MSVLGPMPANEFLLRYWQRESLLVRGAFRDLQRMPDGDTLASLACEEDADARLVRHEAGEDEWRCEFGPFEPERFANLPASGWTLLVQAVDRHLPDVAALLDAFDFLPRWRLDDVMVSYAENGGGVGAHFDHYDVFLLQARGTRVWELGEHCGADTRLRDHPDLRLLAQFEPLQTHHLEAGDMLYVPAGLAHRGTATDSGSMTCSIGFRAPSHGEILQAAADSLARGLRDDERFRDTAASLDADPFLLNDAVADTLEYLWKTLDPDTVRDALVRAFASLVTEPRDPDLIEPIDENPAGDPPAHLGAGQSLRLAHHPASRFAYRLTADGAELYADGDRHPCSARFARALCHRELASADLASPQDRRLLEMLLDLGSVSVEDAASEA